MDKFSLKDFDVQRFADVGVTLSSGTLAIGESTTTLSTTNTTVAAGSVNLGASPINTLTGGPISIINASSTVTITGTTANETFSLNAGGAVITGGGNDNIFNVQANEVTVTVSGSGSTKITNNAEGTTTVVFDSGITNGNHPVTFNGTTGKIVVSNNAVSKTEKYNNGDGLKITFTDSNILNLSESFTLIAADGTADKHVSKNFYYNKADSSITLTQSGSSSLYTGAAGTVTLESDIVKLYDGNQQLNIALNNNIT